MLLVLLTLTKVFVVDVKSASVKVKLPCANLTVFTGYSGWKKILLALSLSPFALRTNDVTNPRWSKINPETVAFDVAFLLEIIELDELNNSLTLVLYGKMSPVVKLALVSWKI